MLSERNQKQKYLQYKSFFYVVEEYAKLTCDNNKNQKSDYFRGGEERFFLKAFMKWLGKCESDLNYFLNFRERANKAFIAKKI